LRCRKSVAESWPLRIGHRGIELTEKKGERIMILGMSLSTFTMVHVIISLIGIVSGFFVLFGLFGSNRMPGMTALFLLTTILTSVTGFLFPFDELLPSHMVGIVSLIMLAIACFALYVMKLSGAWRWIYALTALIALYLNVFVLIIQSFLKIGPLHALAPSVPPSEPPFAVVQGVVLLFFVVAIISAVRRFRPA
jgi:MFS family permease